MRRRDESNCRKEGPDTVQKKIGKRRRRGTRNGGNVVHTERVRPRTTKIIFSLTRLRCEAENSLRRKEIAWVQKIQNIRCFQASSSDYINLLSNIWQIKQLSLWQSRRKILRKSFCQFKILLKGFGICKKRN